MQNLYHTNIDVYIVSYSYMPAFRVATSPGHIQKKPTQSDSLLQISASWCLLSSDTPGSLRKPYEHHVGSRKALKRLVKSIEKGRLAADLCWFHHVPPCFHHVFTWPKEML